MDFSRNTSNREATYRLNRIRHETTGIKTTTYRNMVEEEGKAIQRRIETKSEEALMSNGFTRNGELSENVGFKPEESRHIEIETIVTAMSELTIKQCNPTDYELPEHSINISADDVCVKRQTEIRPRIENDEQAKRVNNTVIHVENSDGKYILNAANLFCTLKILLGFLFNVFVV